MTTASHAPIPALIPIGDIHLHADLHVPERPARVSAVVSRGGRPDLAGAALPRVKAPTLLLVGSRDAPVIELNRTARAHMRGTVVIEIVPGATHLFEEPGTLEHVATRAGEWFATYFAARAARPHALPI